MEFDRQSPCKTPRGQEHSAGPDNPALAIPVMVPGGNRLIDRHITAPPSSSRPNAAGSRGDVTRGDTQTSRVAYLKQSYSAQSLSDPASRLLLASWREKSSKSYDSHFKKWVSWCKGRGTDPISAPVSEVVNFLADLHEKGYSYRSLNAYRSAIASTHDRVDGASVGQHPLVCRLLAGVFNSNPPQPRYTSVWDVKLSM